MTDSGWPQQVLTGRYSFRTRQRDAAARGMLGFAGILTDGLVDVDWKRVLHITVGNRAVMTVLDRGGPRIVTASQVLLALRPRMVQQPRTVASWFLPKWYDVIDCRLGVVVGVLATTGGFIRPARTSIYDPSYRLIGRLVQPLQAFFPSF